MTIKHLIELCNPLSLIGKQVEAELGNLVQDSRLVHEGDVFIALKGTGVDGHNFVNTSIDKGATVIICEDVPDEINKNILFIQVRSTRAIFGLLAQAFHGNPASKLSLVGITGTNGKTTTATLVYQVLTENQKKVALLGTVSKYIMGEVLQSKLTTADPLELAADMKKMVEAGCKYLVMEVSSHALHQGRVSGFDFEVAAFTNISHDHLDYHKTVEEYAKAKKILFDHLPESSFAVINHDDAYAGYMFDDCKAQIITFGEKDGNLKIKENTISGLKVLVEENEIESPLPGRFNAYNIAQAYFICKSLGLTTAEITEALKTAKGAPGRMEVVETSESKLAPKVIVDYAHTPDALENVLSTLSQVKAPNQTVSVVFGAGGDRDTTKRPEMAAVAEKWSQKVYVTSDNPRTENPDLIIADILHGFESTEKVYSITSRKDAIFKAILEASENEIILIAGKGHEDYQEIDGVRHSFDDRLIAKEALALKIEEAQ